MPLFWHNHFVVELSDINDARYGYEYFRLLRQAALGNVKQMTKNVTITPAMLRYLNGNQNKKPGLVSKYAGLRTRLPVPDRPASLHSSRISFLL